MKSIFNEHTRDGVINRICTLNENSKAKWGKMTVVQMMKHCASCEEYYYGNIEIKRSFPGKLFGKIAIKRILKNETSTIGKNAPTATQFRTVNTNLDFEKEKTNWIRLLQQYETYNKDNFEHWFFGKMTKEQLGQFIYKHCDHHLKQFGV